MCGWRSEMQTGSGNLIPKRRNGPYTNCPPSGRNAVISPSTKRLATFGWHLGDQARLSVCGSQVYDRQLATPTKKRKKKGHETLVHICYEKGSLRVRARSLPQICRKRVKRIR